MPLKANALEAFLEGDSSTGERVAEPGGVEDRSPTCLYRWLVKTGWQQKKYGITG
jgi:hypothetical protein